MVSSPVTVTMQDTSLHTSFHTARDAAIVTEQLTASLDLPDHSKQKRRRWRRGGAGGGGEEEEEAEEGEKMRLTMFTRVGTFSNGRADQPVGRGAYPREP